MTDAENTSAAAGQVAVAALLDRERNAVIARGRFDPLYSAFRRHASELGILPDERACLMMRDCLAAVTLHLGLHPPDEFSAWTLNVMRPAMNFFVAGDNSQFIVTGRVWAANVKTTNSSRLFLESQRPRHEPSRSVLEIDGDDVLGIFEQFHERSVQIPSRLFDLEDGQHVFIQGMPRVDVEWLHAFDRNSVRAYLAGEFEPIENRHYSFGCGCDPYKVLKVIHGMYRGNADDLFQGESQVEVSCPRCGRHYWVTRHEFDLGPERVGAA